MKRFCISFFFACSLLLFLLAVPLTGHAQLGDDFIDPDAEVPIDGGLSLLLAVGVGYGVKKANDHRKKNKSVPLF